MKITKDDLLNALYKTANDVKRISLVVADKTKKAYDSAKQYVESKIDDYKAEKEYKHMIELNDYKEFKNDAKSNIEDKRIKDFIDDLGDSYTELFSKSIKKIKESFPIPKEQTILWAHIVNETNRNGGIVVTEKGIFIKTIVNIFEEKALKKENRKVAELFYYPWDMFDLDVLNIDDENSIVSRFRDSNFIEACKRFQDSKNQAKIKAANYYQYADQVISCGIVATSGVLLKDNIKFTRDYGHGNAPNSGFGFFAEQANNAYDVAHFKDAKVVGGDNAKNGADRLVNGVYYQTKYYSTGKKTIDATFGDDGYFRYYNADGSPMKIEVPKGQYESAVKALEDKIAQGRVPGVTDPNEAERMVVEGHYTYD